MLNKSREVSVDPVDQQQPITSCIGTKGRALAMLNVNSKKRKRGEITREKRKLTVHLNEVTFSKHGDGLGSPPAKRR